MRAGNLDHQSFISLESVHAGPPRPAGGLAAGGTAHALQTPRFLIADDHRFVCEALAAVIGRHWPGGLIAQAASFGEVLTHLSRTEFDIALLDFCMPDLSGAAAVAQIRAQYPQVKIVILSGAIEAEEAWEALAKGVVAYVPKSIAADGIVHVLTLVLDGETYVPRMLIDAMAHRPAAEPRVPTGAPGLSARDAQLLDGLIKGHPNKVIAHSMGISESSVKLYMHKLFQTLGVHNRTEAVARGLAQMPARL